jgi:hypothetical protein
VQIDHLAAVFIQGSAGTMWLAGLASAGVLADFTLFHRLSLGIGAGAAWAYSTVGAPIVPYTGLGVPMRIALNDCSRPSPVRQCLSVALDGWFGVTLSPAHNLDRVTTAGTLGGFVGIACGYEVM